MSRKNKTLRAFRHQNPTATIQEIWDAAWNAQAGKAYSLKMQELQAKVDELEGENAELLDKPCSMCGQDERIAKIGKRLGFRPDVGALEIRRLEDKQATLITELRDMIKGLPVDSYGGICMDYAELTALLNKDQKDE